MRSTIAISTELNQLVFRGRYVTDVPGRLSHPGTSDARWTAWLFRKSAATWRGKKPKRRNNRAGDRTARERHRPSVGARATRSTPRLVGRQWRHSDRAARRVTVTAAAPAQRIPRAHSRNGVRQRQLRHGSGRGARETHAVLVR